MDPVNPVSRVEGTKQKSAPTLSTIQVFLATRKTIFLLEDLDGDDICDRQTELAWLDTPGDYPHNGLAGFAFDARGWMYFGFGENLGAPYKLFSQEMKDGTSAEALAGGGEGGNIYRMRPDGTQLSHWATGFWNPHASCVDAFGRLFTVDNDPDSRPPCRLLHVIEGGDYGYRFRNGRKGLHPFTAWDGEIPGTLPMVAGTGEAPSGILAYEHSVLPEEYLGRLFVTSWGDHRIDTFKLQAKGASFTSIGEPLIVGGENFRPVGIALAPDGSLYCTDWVLRDYKVHGQGRVWHILPTDQTKLTTETPSHGENPEERLKSHVLTVRRLAAKELAGTESGREELSKILTDQQQSPRARSEAGFVLGASAGASSPAERNPVDKLDSSDPFASTAAIHAIVSGRIGIEWNDLKTTDLKDRDLNGVLLHRRAHPNDKSFATHALQSSSPQIRRVAVQWAAEEKMTDLRPRVQAVLKSEPMTAELFLATLASLEMLDGKAPQDFDKTPPGKYVLPLLKDEATPLAVKTQALRLVDPTDPALDIKLVTQLARSENPQLKLEAIRTLALSNRPEAMDLLVEIVSMPPGSNRDSGMPTYEEAVLGLAHFMQNPATSERATRTLKEALAHIANSPSSADLAQEIELSLKSKLGSPNGAAIQTESSGVRDTAGIPPHSDDAWRAAMNNPISPNEASRAAMRGRILFFHPNSAGCYKCHTVQGRGGRIGPDLSHIGGTFTREKLIDSILEPSKEISPQFTNWSMVSSDGKIHTGMIVHENEGVTVLGQPDGNLITLKTLDVEERSPQSISVMPEKLEERLSVSDFRDLLAFLQSLK
jgi:putative membrane-bound dehydrogenase-like protein